MGYRRSRGLRVLRDLFLCGKFSGFDAPIGLAGDVDGERGVLESIADGVEDDGIGDDFVPVIQGQLGGEGDGFVDGSFFEDFAQILRFGGGKFPHSHVVKDDEIGFGELVAVAQVGAAGAGEREVFLERGDAHVQHRFAAGAGVQARPPGR